MILVPRPAPHLPRTLAALQAAGLTNLQPLALSHPQTIAAIVPATATALLITSPFGVQSGLPNLPAYCVGEATSTAARAAGLNVVYTGTNNGVTMAREISTLNLKPTRFAHLHGDHAGMQWHTILQTAGHTVTPITAYQTRRITKLPPKLLTPDSLFLTPLIVLLFSAGSATHLANLLKHANMPLNGTAIAFSPAVARAATPHWPHVVTAANPSLKAMIEALRPMTRITNNE